MTFAIKCLKSENPRINNIFSEKKTTHGIYENLCKICKNKQTKKSIPMMQRILNIENIKTKMLQRQEYWKENYSNIFIVSVCLSLSLSLSLSFWLCYSWSCQNPSLTSTQRLGFTRKWLYNPHHHTNSKSGISQLLLARCWQNFKGRFLGISRTDSICHGNIYPGNIYPGNICLY